MSLLLIPLAALCPRSANGCSTLPISWTCLPLLLPYSLSPALSLHSFAQLMKINESKNVARLRVSSLAFALFSLPFFLVAALSAAFLPRCALIYIARRSSCGCGNDNANGSSRSHRRRFCRRRSSFSFQSGHKNVDCDSDAAVNVSSARMRRRCVLLP